jgi:hypothetical protein
VVTAPSTSSRATKSPNRLLTPVTSILMVTPSV